MPKNVKALVVLSDEQLRPLANKLWKMCILNLDVTNRSLETEVDLNDFLDDEPGADEGGGQAMHDRAEVCAIAFHRDAGDWHAVCRVR